MSHENLDRCFKTFHDYNAQSNTDGLKTINPTFMQKAKDEFTNGNVMIKYHIKDKKYVFNELVKFLDHCKVGEWSHAKESYHQASKEYETFVKALDVIKVNANKLQETDHNRVTTISDGANKSTDSNRSRVPRVTMESPIEGQSTSRTPRVKYQTTTKHTTGKMLTTAQNEKTLSNQGQAVQHTSGNTNEYSSRSDKESRMEHHKGNNQFRMTDARNNKATLQEVTSVSPMDADLPSPDYHTNSESNKASIVKPAKTPLPRAAPVSLSKRDTYSLDQDIDKTSDQATRGKTDYDTNDADIYRRSQRASILLRENNPNITDLSDPNRPTRLAERFSELYSNEHTDTFEELTKCCQRESFGDTQEREIVNSLLLVVKKAYEHCTKRNEEIDKKLASEKQTRTTKTEDEAIYLKGQLLQKKKMIAQDKADDVIKVFLKEKIPNLSPSYATERAKSKYKIYAEKTVEIVWWMCVQNPPIHLEYAKSGPFDSSLYRSYTKSGKSIDFCVWPLVRLQRNGPILAKGIAQGILQEVNMATGEVHERLEKCFKGLAAGDWSQLDMHFMKRTLHLFNQNVENKQQDSLHNLTSFLQLCEKGRWNDAKLSFKEAKKEYENYVKTKLSQYPAQGSTAETRELSHEKHSNKEVEETQLMRRSKDASIRLMDNNPNISDLSDPNRPIKLAERFSELYSNAYTDAFEELNGKNSNPAKSIKDLLNIVKDAHVFCKGRRKQIIDNQMTSTGSSPDDPAKRYDSMIKLREAAEKALPTVRKDFMKNRTNDMRVRTQKFAEECVEIVWLMCIQQPPVHLEWVENEREKFNQDLYRGYTRSGEVIEFCVWPVVRLHEKGPILTRGIAQGCD